MPGNSIASATRRSPFEQSAAIEQLSANGAPVITLGALNLFELPTDVRHLITQHGSFRHLSAGAILVTEGARTDHLLFIESGWAYRYNTTRDGARQIIGVCVPGDFCNLDVLGMPSLSYGVRTRVPATILSVPRALAVSAVDESPQVSAFFRRAMSIENAISGRLTMTIGRKSGRARLAHFICEIAARLGCLHQSMEGMPIWVAFTQEDIGDLLGLTPVHICRMVKSLRADRLIDWTGHRLCIRDVAALIRIAEFDDRYLGLAAPKQPGRMPDQRSQDCSPRVSHSAAYLT